MKDEVARAKMFINAYADKRKTINRKFNSYNLKHVAERKMGGYIRDAAFIQAAQELGFDAVRISWNGISCWFNMSFKKLNHLRKPITYYGE